MTGGPADERTGLALTTAAAVLWGTSWVATGFALQGFAPLAVAGWRGLGGFVLLAAFAGRTPLRRSGGREGASPGRLGRVLLLGLLGGGIFQVALAYAVHLSGATLAAFVAGLYPVLAAAGAGPVLGERPDRFVYGGVLTAFAGVVLLAGFDPGGASPAGLAIGLAAATAFAAYLLLTRRWATAWDLSTPLVAASVMGVSAVVALPLALLTGPAGLWPSGGLVPVVALLWLAGPVGALAQAFAVGGVRRLPSYRSSALLLLNPLTAAVLAALLLGERLGPLQVVGCGAVLAGIALATVLGARRRARAAPVTPVTTEATVEGGLNVAGRIL